MNLAESESRPVLGPAGNKTRSLESRKPVSKPKSNTKMESVGEIKGKKSPALSGMNPNGKLMNCVSKKEQERKVFRSNLSMNASCSSDNSSDSSHSRASTGRIVRKSVPILRKQSVVKVQKVVSDGSTGGEVGPGAGEVVDAKKRCAWVTPNTDPCYVAFHDEEWGSPVHDDRKLFELLSLSTALAELAWPAILNKRHMFRDVFQDFDPVAVAKLNEKRITAIGSSASSLLSELKLRVIIENARQMCKIIDEFGSFDKYIWGFVNHKPTIGNFRYPRQVPIKTSKADVISKDLVKRGLRGVGPTVVYSFMQVAGITNDHLISCFRFQECISAECAKDKDDSFKDRFEGKQTEDETDLDVTGAIDRLSLSQD
ncbi:GuaA [Heracleum sosnowskyi]|uniref:GuaA n=1 Tax=Heracleum sosnowskyi TaxID=360622 RepID=A0AAD8M428_9APIA|nr:GuaA [Heracleum sosnowskyi]